MRKKAMTGAAARAADKARETKDTQARKAAEDESARVRAMFDADRNEFVRRYGVISVTTP